MSRSLPKVSAAVSCWRKPIAAVLLSSLLVLALAPAASAATSTNAWLAKVGSSGANGTASINAYTTGVGSLVLKLKKLPASRTLAVTLLKTSCKGSALFTLSSIKSTSTGAATKTLSLTAARVTAIKKATTGTGKFAIRIGTGTTAKCGVFAAQLVPAYIAARIPVGRAPSGVAIDPTGVYVTNWWDNTLSRINPATNTVLQVLPIVIADFEGPEAITSGGGSLWLTTSEFNETETLAGSILRVDPATGNVLATIAGGRGAFDIAYGHGAVWVPNVLDGTVQRIDAVTNQPVTSISINAAFGVAVDATAVWVIDVLGIVHRIDPATNTVVATIPTQSTGALIQAGGGSIWVTHPGQRGSGNGSVSRINPATNQVIANIPVGDYPFDLAIAGGSVWVGLFYTGTVVRINVANNAILSKLTVPAGVYAIAGTASAVYAVHNPPVAEGALEPPLGSVTRVGY